MQILECKSIRGMMIDKLKTEIDRRLALAIIQIGDFPENTVYLKSKKKLALELDIEIIEIKYYGNNCKNEIISKILELNMDNRITGIMIQKPIIDGFDYQELVDLIDPMKDVEGLNSRNQLKLINGDEAVIPCTVSAILKVFHEYEISLLNRKIVIIGKSNLIGRPLYHILNRNNEVLLCDSKTLNLSSITRSADIVIVAIGKPNYFDSNYFRCGQIVIDVGTNYVDDKLVGDVDFNSVKDLVSITPVPGGVGQLTPICLFENLLDLSK